ncbi:hypothetical protein [Hamadaea tsunoensis]|uniref:hypothetical protein n=1 Tax=Hamadaea tsunoensis TaxID=53368 RepID=UPI0012F9F211|nr:hypothetical protein [Hamadaea tsunoensis]
MERPLLGTPINVSALGGDGSRTTAIGVLHNVTHVYSGRAPGFVGEHLVKFARSVFYVKPDPVAYRKAETCLDGQGVVVIEGDRGTGRETDAYRLLAYRDREPDVHGGTLTLQQLPVDWDEPTTVGLPRILRGRFILDLSNEREVTESFARSLRSYGEELEKIHSMVVVIVTPLVWDRVRPMMESLTVSFDARPADEIMRAHLAYHGGDGRSRALLARNDVVSLMAELAGREASPAEAAEVAEKLSRGQAGDLELVIDECRRWGHYIGTQLGVREPDTADRRVLFVAAAALNGCSSEAVAAADASLGVALRLHSAPPFRVLETPGWTERTREIGATVRDDRTWMDDKRPGVDLAVIGWVYREHPGLRSALLKWLHGLVHAPATSPFTDRIAGVHAYLAAEFPAARLLDTAYGWLSKGAPDARLGYLILEKGLSDPSTEPLLRRKLWEWAYRGSVDAIPALARLCAEILGPRLPHASLGRLRHLIRGAEAAPQHCVAVAEALRVLARLDGLAGLVLEKAVDWAGDETSHVEGVRAVSALLDPRPRTSVLPDLLAAAQADLALRASLSRAWQILIGDESSRVEVTSMVRTLSRAWGDMGEEAIMLAKILLPAVREQLDGAGWAILDAMDLPMRTDVLLYAARHQRTVVATVAVETVAAWEFSPAVGVGAGVVGEVDSLTDNDEVR